MQKKKCTIVWGRGGCSGMGSYRGEAVGALARVHMRGVDGCSGSGSYGGRVYPITDFLYPFV